ncbi:hypothetical protein PsorP6_009906 [Peronosclerospora sorghi]|uniref:Uncharacterized protein n=1 Tax=Peronosclerospora sorghi TaxID=230839 RepID=A0ACC0W0E3_9STRA|nr:hypothetical protein PsorP6_009906 [Peronosclerospora sorghi]
MTAFGSYYRNFGFWCGCMHNVRKQNCPGSWNDVNTSRKFREKLILPARTLTDYGVLADLAFPVINANKIVTPLKDGELQRVVREGVSQLLLEAVHNAIAFLPLLHPLPYNPVTRQLRLNNINFWYNRRVLRTSITKKERFYYRTRDNHQY